MSTDKTTRDLSTHDLSTLCIRGGLTPDPTTGAILTPIYQTATYVQEAIGQHKGHTYSRASNPTVSALEANLGSLEGAPPSVCFATGLAAIHALFLAVLKSGDHVICSDVIYGGTYRLLREVLSGLGIESSFVDTSRPAVVRDAIRPTTRLLLIETPGNPTLKLTDVAAIAAITKPRKITLAVDNTFLTPVGLRPLDLGADVSVYSTTKYIEGHNATVGGALTSHDATLLERFRFIRKSVGSIQAPQDAWLTLRGIKTLPCRLRQHSESAQIVAEWLESHPAVERVWFPGLKSFPQHDLAIRQHTLHAGIIAFEVRGGVDAGVRVLNSVKLISLAESLGAVESLITHPVTMTHGSVPREERLAIGITDGLIRLSVGLESPKDIIADLEQALQSPRREPRGAWFLGHNRFRENKTAHRVPPPGSRRGLGRRAHVVNSLTVLKFGSSVLPTEGHLPIAVREIQYWTSRGHRVIAVVSALGDTTDRLLDRARKDANANGHADECATAALLATGEATTAALLGLALAKAGTAASVLDAAAIGLRTEGPILDSRAIDLDRGAVHRALARRPVAVVPGFLGRDEHGQTTLLGRGGSDLTALFLAGELFADQCVLLKDVDGLYDRDPSEDPVGARRYLRANYEDVLQLTGGIVQHKAVRYARDRRTQFTVATPGRFDGSLIWGGDTVFLPVQKEPAARATSQAPVVEPKSAHNSVTSQAH